LTTTAIAEYYENEQSQFRSRQTYTRRGRRKKRDDDATPGLGDKKNPKVEERREQ